MTLNDTLAANILTLLQGSKFDEASLAVNALDDESRKALRVKVEALGLPLLRNLYFNYETQTWID